MRYRILLAAGAIVGWSTLALTADSVSAVPETSARNQHGTHNHTRLVTLDSSFLTGGTQPILPDGLGVNIHFKRARPGEVAMLAKAGFRWIRMDFTWSATERKKGEYDFSDYDYLIASLKPHGIRTLFILDYGNKFHDGGLSPHTDEGRKAFARWAAAAAMHFKGQGILWEMFNEPNIGFWKPHPNVDDYVKLALEVGKALRKAAPGETYIGPATSRVDFEFLETCFQAGLLEYWSAVSVHPYRQQGPETATPEYARLTHMIDKYAPVGKHIPIVSGEWGYSSAWAKMDPTTQGRMLSRQWLTNLANNIPISIWYDWHDDGRDPQEPEHHFGTVAHPYHADRNPVYDPKPAYLAARTLTQTLAGYVFSKRLDVGNDQAYVLLFSRNKDVCLAAWTTTKQPIGVTIPASSGAFAVVGHTGQPQTSVTAGASGIAIQLTGEPLFLTPKMPNDLLRVAAACGRMPTEIVVPASAQMRRSIEIRNPLAKPLSVRSGTGRWITLKPGEQTHFSKTIEVHRADNRKRMAFACEVQGLGTFVQSTRITASNPLSIRVLPATGRTRQVEIGNPSGDAFRGSAHLTEAEGIRIGQSRVPIVLNSGETSKTVTFACSSDLKTKYRIGARITDEKGSVQSEAPVQTFLHLSHFDHLTPKTVATALRLISDGDHDVASQQTLGVAAPPRGPLVVGASVLKLTYQFDSGWKFIRLAPLGAERQAISGRPTAFGLWIHGDGSGGAFRLRVTDATGQTFQPSGPRIRWHGWQYVQVPLNGEQAGHWGGADDGVIHYPIHWDSLVLIDSAHRKACEGTIYLSLPTLIY